MTFVFSGRTADAYLIQVHREGEIIENYLAVTTEVYILYLSGFTDTNNKCTNNTMYY